MTYSLFFMVREMVFLMSMLVSYLVGSDSQLSDASHTPQHKNSNVLGGSGEKSIWGITNTFLQCPFSSIEIEIPITKKSY